MKLSCDIVLLSAGISKRMGLWKPLLPYRDFTLIQYLVKELLNISESVILVGGYRGSELQSLFKDHKGVIFVMNFNFNQGIFSSVQAAVSRVKSLRFFITLGDLPFIKRETYHKLFNTSESASAVVPLYNNQRGHPVLIDSKLIPSIIEARGYETMREFLSKEIIETLPMDDPGIIRDLDTLEDYREACRIFL